MDKNYSERHKVIISQLKKEFSFGDGIKNLIDLREDLFSNHIEKYFSNLSKDDFCKMPFAGSSGNSDATIAWSIYHIFRIEDIICHDFVSDDEQIFFSQNYQKKMNCSVITTANEMNDEQMVAFSKEIKLEELFSYAKEVKSVSQNIIRNLTFKHSKVKVSEQQKQKLLMQNVVSTNSSAFWLVDYWCKKSMRGLLQMPFSRHWIMHIEACERICKKI